VTGFAAKFAANPIRANDDGDERNPLFSAGKLFQLHWDALLEYSRGISLPTTRR